MTKKSRRAFLGTLGTAMGGTLLVREGVRQIHSSIRSNSHGTEKQPIPTDSLRVDRSGRNITVQRGTLRTDLNSIDAWMSLSGEFTLERESINGSSSSLRLASNPIGKIEHVFDEPFNIGENTICFWLKALNNVPSQIRIRLLAPDEQNQLITSQYLSKDLANTWFGIEVGPTNKIGSPDSTNISRMQIEVAAEDQAVLLDRFKTKPTADTGRVMLIFDDNRASVSTAYEEMHRRGLSGAIAVIPDLVNAGGHLSADQLATYHADGWDLLSHPQLEEPLPMYSQARQRQEIIRAKEWLVTNGYQEGADHFVAPFGKVSPDTLEIIEVFHYTNYMTSEGLSGTPPTDPLTINRVAIDNISHVKRQIQRAARFNMLVVLSAHTVGNQNDQWVSQEDFINILDFIKGTDVEVVTPIDYWKNEISRTRSD
ncbi:polysaccharide deacetylase [Natrinema hispanicum]|uniref:Polysaccharide deacetylase n=1 Tax=Natrinema hispanicum TaxID=392421 RepID=A0A482Y869_9EURY|nr:polysaccharide deacetylase family protein [Natrinema hispanicum]RZV06057.1 polysaccharide deacetylase [Natrinema hispanicum]